MNTVQAFPISDSKWKLAERLAGNTKLPEQAFERLFAGIIIGMEAIAKTNFDSTLKEKIWNQIMPQKIEFLRTFFLTKLCQEILGSFEEDATKDMLNEHQKTGFIRNVLYSSQLQAAYCLNHKEMIESIKDRASSMADELVPTMVQLAKEEGVVFPNLNGMTPQ